MTAAPSTCCSLTKRPLEAEESHELSLMFKALSDPVRLRLLSHVAAQGCGAVCVCDLTEVAGIGQPTVSHHMKKLVDAGLLTREQHGRWAHYRVVPETFSRLCAVLDLS